MIGPQAVLAGIVVALVLALASGRVRADVAGVVALVAGVLGGVVPAEDMLAGFGQAPVLAVAGLGVLAAALRNAGVLVVPVRILAPVLDRGLPQLSVLGAIGVAVAAVVGGAGAQSAFLTVPSQVLRARHWPSPATIPVALATVLGGLVTPLGSPAGLVLLAGAGVGVLDMARVGGPVAAGGLLVLLLAWRLAPPVARQDGGRGSSDAYVSEVQVPAGSPAVGRTLDALSRAGAPTGARAVIREEYRRLPARPSLVIEAGDVLVLYCDTDTLQRVIEQVRGTIAGAASDRSAGVVEAVVMAGSRLVGQSAADGQLGAAQIGLLGIGRVDRLPVMRLARTKLRAGDTLVLQGDLERMPDALAGLGVLKLAERRLRLGRTRRALVPLLASVGVLLAVATGVPLALAMLAAVAVVVLAGNVPAGELYDGVDWPLVVLVGALLPLGAAMGATGLAGLMAGGLAGLAWPGWVWAGAVLAVALAGAAVSGVATAVLLLPCVLALADRTGLPAAPLVVALAIGASCRVRGLGGGRLGWVVVGYVLVAGAALIGWSWPR